MCLRFQNLLKFKHIFEHLPQRIGNLIFPGAKSPLCYATLRLSQGKRYIYHNYKLYFVTRRKTWCPDLTVFYFSCSFKKIEAAYVQNCTM
jgi:hypothetical protein